MPIKYCHQQGKTLMLLSHGVATNKQVLSGPQSFVQSKTPCLLRHKGSSSTPHRTWSVSEFCPFALSKGCLHLDQTFCPAPAKGFCEYCRYLFKRRDTGVLQSAYRLQWASILVHFHDYRMRIATATHLHLNNNVWQVWKVWRQPIAFGSESTQICLALNFWI